MDAVHVHNIEIMRLLLDSKANPNLQTPEPDHWAVSGGLWTAVAEAAFVGSVDALRCLVSYGADVLSKNSEGMTPLHIAAEAGQANQVAELIRILRRDGLKQSKCDKFPNTAVSNAVNATRKSDHRTPLHLACTRGYHASVCVLLACKANAEAMDDLGNSALQIATKRCSIACVEALLMGKPSAVGKVVARCPSTDSFTKWQEASEQASQCCSTAHSTSNMHGSNGGGGEKSEPASFLPEDAATTQTLQQTCWTPALVDGRPGCDRNALRVAAAEGRRNMLGLLLKHKADVNGRSHNGTTAVMLAARFGQASIVRKLVQAKADVNLRSTTGQSAAHAAMWRGYADIVRCLILEGNADFQGVEQVSGLTPFQAGVAQGCVGAVKVALMYANKRLDATQRTATGQSVMHLAAKANEKDLSGTGPVQTRVGMVRALLQETDPDVVEVDENGDTPLHLAVRQGCVKVSQLLVGYLRRCTTRTLRTLLLSRQRVLERTSDTTCSNRDRQCNLTMQPGAQLLAELPLDLAVSIFRQYVDPLRAAFYLPNHQGETVASLAAQSPALLARLRFLGAPL
eukprot:INCI14545.1.p1 GENE.INCI14545.1~~INCI14545.1.p1  ORF type:complete len:668 (-),score=103.16 INCI14545.1:46-1755(-)